MIKTQETQGKEAAEDKMETEMEVRMIKARITMKKIRMKTRMEKMKMKMRATAR